MPLGQPPKEFCDAQIKKVVRSVLTFDDRGDSQEWRDCATAYVDEACARRYLMGVDWLVSRAVVAIAKTIHWRLRLGLQNSSPGFSDASRGWKTCCAGYGPNNQAEEAKPIRVSRVMDTEGRPIVVLSARRWPKGDQQWLDMTIDALEEAEFQTRHDAASYAGGWEDDQHVRLKKSSSAISDTWAWLIDLEGVGPSDVPSWNALRTLDSVLFAHYPGRLAKVLIVNASALLRISISMVERLLLTDKARSRMVIVDGQSVKLEQFIPSADLQAVLSHDRPVPSDGQHATSRSQAAPEERSAKKKPLFHDGEDRTHVPLPEPVPREITDTPPRATTVV